MRSSLQDTGVPVLLPQLLREYNNVCKYLLKVSLELVLKDPYTELQRD